MTRRRVAIVGLSWIAADLPAEASDPTVGTAIPYSHASAIAAIPELDVVAGCDIVPGRPRACSSTGGQRAGRA